MDSLDPTIQEGLLAVLKGLEARNVSIASDSSLMSKELTNTLVKFLDGEMLDFKRLTSIGGKTPLHSLAISFMSLFVLVAHSVFMVAWSAFDLMLEIIIMRELNIDPIKNCIVCGVLQHGSKMEVIVSLLQKRGDNVEGIKLLRKAQEEAARNSIAHSFLHSENAQSALYYREVKNKLTVKKRPFDIQSMSKHVIKFAHSAKAVKEHFSITDADVSSYQKSIASLAQAPATLE